ncbi:MAG: LURP-one-related family protein [Firmicutes bacterium]|nr:LURP-one-related family protein [Bacillota bacterium]
MGFFSKLKDLQDFHGEGERPSENVVKHFGEPARSLYTESKFTLNNRIDVTDDQGQILYQTNSKIVSVRGKTDIMDAKGNPVAHIEKPPVSLHEKHFITMADGREFTLSNELFHIVRDITNIEGLGWTLKGNVIGLNFNLFDQYGEPVAAISQKMVSLRNRYSMDIYQPEQEAVVVAIVIALGKMLEARREDDVDSSSVFSIFGND